jgi:RHS repeat-associated protein
MVPHYFDAGSQYKKVEAQRLARERNLGTTFYGWDGDTLAWETTNEESTHYFYEPDSFVPLAQGVQNHAIQLHKTPDWTDRDYRVKDDPLWTQVFEPNPFDKLGFYHCDHLGTPQEITDEAGNIAWQAQYKAWGEAKEVISKAAGSAGFKNPIRFQGQYFDHETGLHYNRYRYYDPETGRFISKDPIGFSGGWNVFTYVSDPVEWVDLLGLSPSSTLNKALNGSVGDKMDAHHIIPVKEWSMYKDFLEGLGLKRNEAQNGVLMPESKAVAKCMGRKFYHNTNHEKTYANLIRRKLEKITSKYGDNPATMTPEQKMAARKEVEALQLRTKLILQAPGKVPRALL